MEYVRVWEHRMLVIRYLIVQFEGWSSFCWREGFRFEKKGNRVFWRFRTLQTLDSLSLVFPIITFWVGVWTCKHHVTRSLRGSKHLLTRYLEDFGRGFFEMKDSFKFVRFSRFFPDLRQTYYSCCLLVLTSTEMSQLPRFLGNARPGPWWRWESNLTHLFSDLLYTWILKTFYSELY